MDQHKLLELQTKRGAKAADGFTTDRKSIDAVVAECRKQIEEKSESYRDLAPDKKRETIKRIIIDYVMNQKPLVVGYMDSEGRPDTVKLVDKLVEDITNYGILTAAMLDEAIFEIRCNGKELKVEKNGRVVDLTDKDGNIVQFSSPEQQEIIMRKFLGDVRLTPKDALIQARTLEGYRIAAVHSSAMQPDPNDPNADKYHSFVLRKFKKSKMNLQDIVKFNTLSDNMARFLALCTAGGLTFITCGATASGKTTTNNAILQSVPPSTRVVLLQNPQEIDLRFKDDTGRIYNDVLHLEAREIENPQPTDPTMANMMDATLRLSPVLVVLGEIRTDNEYAQAMKILLAGHPLNQTYHSDSDEGAIQRFLTAFLATSSGTPASLALRTLTSLLNIIIVQRILRDGSRRIIQISEVLGVDPDNENKPLLNELYRYDIIGEPEYDNNGIVRKIHGVHKRVGKISEKTIKRFQLEGVASQRYDFLMKDVDPSEVETYTGEDIENYGMKK